MLEIVNIFVRILRSLHHARMLSWAFQKAWHLGHALYITVSSCSPILTAVSQPAWLPCADCLNSSHCVVPVDRAVEKASRLRWSYNLVTWPWPLHNEHCHLPQPSAPPLSPISTTPSGGSHHVRWWRNQDYYPSSHPLQVWSDNECHTTPGGILTSISSKSQWGSCWGVAYSLWGHFEWGKDPDCPSLDQAGWESL